MEDKSYEVDKMLNTLIDLAKEEVDKAKSRGYFGKDVVEPVAMIIELAHKKSGTGGYGTYGNGRNDYPGYGNYNYGRGNYGYGHDDYGEEYEDGTGTMRDGRRRYGRSG